MTWSDWNWINVFCVFFSGYVANDCFKNNNLYAGWLNVFASAANGAIIAIRLI